MANQHTKKKVFVFPDIHFPFHNKKALDKAFELLKKEKPDIVLNVGDLMDQYVFSKYTKDLNLITPEKEVKKAMELAQQFWKKVKTIVPKARCIQLLGNHDVRIIKRIREKLPELASLFNFTEKLYSFQGVECMKTDRDFLEIDGIVYCHGWLTQLGAHSRYFRKSVVHGHSHRPGIVYDRVSDSYTFEMDVGHLADENSTPLGYTASTQSRWLMAIGVVDNGMPRLVILQ